MSSEELNNVEHIQTEDPLDDDNYDDMPGLCDKEEVSPSGDDATVESADGMKEPEPAEPEPLRAKVGEWEDILGSGRLRKKVVVEGSSLRPERGSRVQIRLTESLQEDTQIVKEKTDVTFNVGESEVLQCLDLVVPLMYIGETSLVESESDFCYGEVGDGDRVPPKSKLYIKVELVSSRLLPAVPDIDLVERASIGNEKRLRGNTWYSRGEHSQAVQCYRKAVEYLDDESIDNEVEVPVDRFMLAPEIQELLINRVKAYNNMAQAQMKLNAWDSALASVKQVLKIEPNNEKALFRKAKILQHKYRTEEAIGILRRVTRLYPANKQAQGELSLILTKERKGRAKEQAMSRKMLGITESSAKPSSSFSQQTKLIVACLGGIGALVGAVVAKTYNLF